MLRDPNRKIIGAFVVGFALIAGAYTVANFGKPRLQQPAAVVEAGVADRVAIDVTDEDNNGIEDWRDAFITTEPVIIDENKNPDNYEPPTTLTGKTGINFFEGIIRARNSGPFGKTPDQVVESTVEALAEQTAHDLYDTADVFIIENWNDNDIKNYANTMAGIVLNSSVKPAENELLILEDVLNRGKTERMQELVVIAGGYETLRDTSLSVPVPAILLKQHLDLINTYHAVFTDIDGMTKSVSDPAFALMRIKRYSDDALGLKYAMQNMNDSLKPFAHLFTSNDPAVFFTRFDSSNQSQ